MPITFYWTERTLVFRPRYVSILEYGIQAGTGENDRYADGASNLRKKPVQKNRGTLHNLIEDARLNGAHQYISDFAPDSVR